IQPNAALGKMMMAGITADIGFVHLFMTGFGAQYQVAWLRAAGAPPASKARGHFHPPQKALTRFSAKPVKPPVLWTARPRSHSPETSCAAQCPAAMQH